MRSTAWTVWLALVFAVQAAAQAPVALNIPSGDGTVDAQLYRAAGAGLHPTLLLLHGYPGNQQNLDLAEAAQRAGWNALVMHYRGSWGSTGWFSVENALADVTAVLAQLRSAAAARDWGSDPTRIALAGHSMGGALALAVAAGDERVRCVAGLAPTNAAVQARAAGADAGVRAAMVDALETPTRLASPAIRFAPGSSGANMVDYLVAHAAELDLPNLAGALARRRVLLVGGSDDRLASPVLHLQPLLQALQQAGAADVSSTILPADHNFTGERAGLAELVVLWLRGC